MYLFISCCVVCTTIPERIRVARALYLDMHLHQAPRSRSFFSWLGQRDPLIPTGRCRHVVSNFRLHRRYYSGYGLAGQRFRCSIRPSGEVWLSYLILSGTLKSMHKGLVHFFNVIFRITWNAIEICRGRRFGIRPLGCMNSSRNSAGGI
jgi:hypothetical protein